MKVLVISRSVHPLHGYGGLERHVGQVLEVLKENGVRVTLITRPPASSGLRTAAHHEVYVPYTRFPFRPGSLLDRNTNYLLWTWSLARLMAGLQPHRDTDAIYGHGLAGIAGVIASSHLGPITCLNPHGLEEFRTKSFLKRLSYWPTRFLERTYAPRCAVVVATDRALVGAVQEFLGVDITRIAVIPNAVDLGAIDVRIAACAPKGKPRDGRVRIVSTGRLEPNKGQDLLIQAVARLPNTELILVGDGSQRHRLASLISRLGVDERVSLVGKVTDLEVTEIYTSSDIYCQPSLYEGSSIAVLEAMAHRLPVVATRTGGLPDKVIPGITGLLVAPGSLEQLIEALKVLSQDAYLRAKMGRNGRELVHSQFSWEVTGPKLVGLLMSLGSVC